MEMHYMTCSSVCTWQLLSFLTGPDITANGLFEYENRVSKHLWSKNKSSEIIPDNKFGIKVDL